MTEQGVKYELLFEALMCSMLQGKSVSGKAFMLDTTPCIREFRKLLDEYEKRVSE